MSEWISIKKRLPYTKQIVLVFTELGEMAVCRADISFDYYIFILNDTSHQIVNVTHWMDLPDPPKSNTVLKVPRSFEAMGEKG